MADDTSPPEKASPPPSTPDSPASDGDAPSRRKLPVAIGGAADTVKRGIALLREDFLKTAPQKAGVGRQDLDAFTMKPLSGEPGYKAAAYELVKVSELGISPFPDDANAVGKVGGIEAVKKAARDVREGKSAKEIKKEVLNIGTDVKDTETEVFDIPDYLKPLPEDTPRPRMTWKNYKGR